MGQHKHNPTAIKAANGELLPKIKPMGKREHERLMHDAMYEALAKAVPGTEEIINLLSEKRYYKMR